MYPQKADTKKEAKVCARNQRISRKHSTEVGRLIKGMSVTSAKNYLSEVLKLKKAIPYTRYTDSLGHKPGMGPGRYPLIVTRKFIELLNSVEKNAENQGLDTKKLTVKTVWAADGASYYRPRRSEFRGQTTKSTNISITVKEGN